MVLRMIRRSFAALVLALVAFFAAAPGLAKEDKLQTYLDKAEAIAAERGMVLGNRKGTLTIYKFFDYNCGYCRGSVAFMDRMIRQNPQLKLVVIDNPTLSDASVEAALAMARIPASKRHKAHYAAVKPGRRDGAWVERYAKDNGLSLGAWNKKDDPTTRKIIGQLQYNRSLAKAIGFQGVPGFVIGRKFFNGFDETILAKAICEETGGKNCG
ncbi:MAG: thioredoxin domain-containing protein [Sphingomonadaceae bacterium]